jgi:HNH endonuclease/NUMOD4 motif/IclR helix-turn-helix domain
VIGRCRCLAASRFESRVTVELWLPTRLDPRYEVSSEGRVRRNARLLKSHLSDSGYARVRTPRVLLVHKAVLEAFVGPPPSRHHQAAHLNGIKSDNRLQNLAWKSPEDNEADKRTHGTAPRRFTGHRRTDHVDRVLALAGKMSFTRIAKETGLHRSSVSRIVRGLRRGGWMVKSLQQDSLVVDLRHPSLGGSDAPDR